MTCQYEFSISVRGEGDYALKVVALTYKPQWQLYVTLQNSVLRVLIYFTMNSDYFPKQH